MLPAHHLALYFWLRAFREWPAGLDSGCHFKMGGSASFGPGQSVAIRIFRSDHTHDRKPGRQKAHFYNMHGKEGQTVLDRIAIDATLGEPERKKGLFQGCCGALLSGRANNAGVTLRLRPGFARFPSVSR